MPRHPALRGGLVLAALSLMVGRELGHIRLWAGTIHWDLTQAGHGVWFSDPELSFDPAIKGVKVTLLTPGEGEPSWQVDGEGVSQLTVVLEEFDLSGNSWMPLVKNVRWKARAIIGRSDGMGRWGGGVFDAGDGCPLWLRMEFDSGISAAGAVPRNHLRDQILERIHKRLDGHFQSRLSRLPK